MSAAERLAEAESLLQQVLAERHDVRRGGRIVRIVTPMSKELEKKVRDFLS